MAWITTKDGRHVDTDWFDKEKRIAQNKADADKLNADREMNRQELLSKFVDKNDYSNQQDYRQLSDDYNNHVKQDRELSERLKELREQLDKETSYKPREKWTDEDKINALLGVKPVSYTDKGKELQKEYNKLNEQQRGIREKIEHIQLKMQRKKRRSGKKKDRYFKREMLTKIIRGFKQKQIQDTMQS